MKYIFLSLITLSFALSSFADDRHMTLEQRRERVETVIIGKFAEELVLTPEEAEKFYPRLRQFRADTEELQRELVNTNRQLDELSNGVYPNDESSTTDPMSLSQKSTERIDVKALISKSNSLQTEILAKREALLTELADFLSPKQVSRCSILLEELPRRIRQFMEERGGPPDRDRGRSSTRQKRHPR